MAEYLAQNCCETPKEYARLIQLFQNTNQAFPFEGNRVDIYTGGYSKLQALLRELQRRGFIFIWNITSLRMILWDDWYVMY